MTGRYGWGLGVNLDNNKIARTYGRPEDPDPNFFSPDPECCTPDEIEAWERAKVEWDNKHTATP